MIIIPNSKAAARGKAIVVLCVVSAAVVALMTYSAADRAPRRLDAPLIPGKSKLAVLHVGPHKSGSSTIQSLMESLGKELERDGFILPKDIPGHFGSFKSMANVAFSLQTNSEWATTPDTWPHFIQFIENQTDLGNNVLLSSEEFDRPVVNVEGIAMALKDFEHVRVVAVYRRAYTWLLSLYYQNHLPRKYRNRDMGPWLSFVDWLKDFNNISLEWREGGQITTVINRYKKYFNDVVVVDFQNEVEPFAVEFFCDAIPDAKETCKSVKSDGKQKGATKNKGDSIEYVRLVYDARFHGLIHEDVTYREAEVSVKHYHEVVKGKTLRDLPHNCLQDDLKEVLFQITLAEERELIPHLFKRSDAEANLRADFNDFDSAGLLCSIDVPKILQQQEWIDFLGGLKPEVSVNSQ